jgi:hypothetical protein
MRSRPGWYWGHRHKEQDRYDIAAKTMRGLSLVAPYVAEEMWERLGRASTSDLGNPGTRAGP